MKGLIVIPRGIVDAYIPAGRYIELFQAIEKKLDFGITDCSDFREIGPEYNIVVNFKNPTKGRISHTDGLLNLKPEVKLVSYLTDLHSHIDINSNLAHLRHHDAKFDLAMEKVLERSDMVLCPYPTFFKKRWGKFIDKFVHFPHFVNHNSIKIWQPKDMRCMLSGASEIEPYPFRNSVSISRDQNIYTLEHPGYGAGCQVRDDKYKVGPAYYKELSKFFCALATPSVLGYVVAKYMEIPACGCLLLAEHTEDMDMLGFQDGLNYIRTNKEKFHNHLHSILDSPEIYSNIIKNGYNLIMNNYTIEHATRRFIAAMEAL